MAFNVAYTQILLRDLKAANTEAAKKELFGIYLTQQFHGDAQAEKLIRGLALGAEQTIVNISRGPVARSGRADTQTSTIIIEWEKDLSKTGAHAVDQLRDYLAGNWRAGQEYRFVLVATDGMRWRSYAPDWSTLKENILKMGGDFKLRGIDKFDLTNENVFDFPFFLDRTLLVTNPKQATLENIAADFGDTSSVFINSQGALRACISLIEEHTELKVAFDQWRSFLSVAYGEFDSSPEMFLVHTYLSVFSKMIAFSVLSPDTPLSDHTLPDVLTGEEFNRLNVERFVENDFFHWVATEPYYSTLRRMYKNIQKSLADYDLSRIDEDILKGLYQELIDLDTRHALGEYYTPDWLCERIVSELSIGLDQRVLDPACGSGSFLRAVAEKLKNAHPDATAEQLATVLYGIDIHPLSVQITKTTMLFALKDRLDLSARPVNFNVYLANSLLVPSGSADLFKSRFTVTVDSKSYDIDIKGLEKAEDFDHAIDICASLVEKGSVEVKESQFVGLVRPQLPDNISSTLLPELYAIYSAIKRATDSDRNGIWRFILQNSYKPIFLRKYFDVIVGNPPWLTYSDIRNTGYQDIVRRLATKYSVCPAKKNMPHLEIASVFVAHCVNYFLKVGGKIAFVLPRSFISADQHDNTRRGQVSNVRLTSVWDLYHVKPLFRVPSSVIWATSSSGPNAIPANGIRGSSFSGSLPTAQVHYNVAKPKLKEAKVTWYYSALTGARRKRKTALTNRQYKLIGKNAYEEQFKQGATLLPRTFYFVTPETKWPSVTNFDKSVIPVKTADLALQEAKGTWKVSLRGRIEGRFVFDTVISRNILPFTTVNPLRVVLPLEVTGRAEKRFSLLDNSDLFRKGATNTSAWFKKAEHLYNSKRTERAKANKLSMLGRLDYQSGITSQPPNFDWMVLYTSSSKDASAAVVAPTFFERTFVCDHKAYWFATRSEDEAHYVCGFLNSSFANGMIKDFQSKGLMGARDVHKTILMLPLPKFSSTNMQHKAIVKYAKRCARTAKAFAEASVDALSASALGRARMKLRTLLSDDLVKLDELLTEMIVGEPEDEMRKIIKRAPRRKREGAAGDLFS